MRLSCHMRLLAEDIKDDLVQAAIATVNIQAALARKNGIRNIQSDFTIRNNFTVRQVQFTPMAQGKHQIENVQSVIGITEKAGYMARQEKGGDRTPRRGRTLAIPTDVARGGSRRRSVITPMRVGNIDRSMRVHGSGTRNWNTEKAKGWFVARAFVAYSKGLFLPMGGSGDQRNLHKVVSFRRRGSGQIFEAIQVYRFDMDRTHTPAQPWLWPASEKVAKDGQRIFNSQAKKLGL